MTPLCTAIVARPTGVLDADGAPLTVDGVCGAPAVQASECGVCGAVVACCEAHDGLRGMFRLMAEHLEQHRIERAGMDRRDKAGSGEDGLDGSGRHGGTEA